MYDNIKSYQCCGLIMYATTLPLVPSPLLATKGNRCKIMTRADYLAGRTPRKSNSSEASANNPHRVDSLSLTFYYACRLAGWLGSGTAQWVLKFYIALSPAKSCFFTVI